MPLLHRQAPRTLRGHLARALVSTIVITSGALALLAVDGAGRTGSAERFADRIATGHAPPRTEQMMKRYDCSTTGYADRGAPRSAIVQRPSGRLAAVTFDEGWQVYTAQGPEALVAVCLRPVP